MAAGQPDATVHLPPAPWVRVWFVCIGFALIFAALAAHYISTSVFTTLSIVSATIPTVWACWWGFQHFSLNRRFGWLFIGLATFALQWGHLTWRFYVDSLPAGQSPNSTAWVWTAAATYVVLSAGLLLLQESSLAAFWRHFLDGATIAVAAAMVIWSSNQVLPWIEAFNAEILAKTELAVVDDVMWSASVFLVLLVCGMSLVMATRRRQPCGIFAVFWGVVVLFLAVIPGLTTDAVVMSRVLPIIVAVATLLTVTMVSRGAQVLGSTEPTHEVAHPIVSHTALLISILAAGWGRVYVVGLDIVSGVLLSTLAVTLISRNLITHRENIQLVKELRQREQHLLFRNNHDQLTGIHSRSRFFEVLQQELNVPSASPIAVAYIDLDQFKEVNDEYGHASGDLLLTTIAQRLTDILPHCPSIARLAGDEFAMIIPAEKAHEVGAQIVHEVARPVRVEGGNASVTASVGIASCLFEAGAPSLKDVLARSDQAMYEIKRTTANGFLVVCCGDECTPSDDCAELLASNNMPWLESSGAPTQCPADVQPS